MSQKKCPSCKADVANNAKFCPDCGAPITGAAKKKAQAQKSNSVRDTMIIVGVLAVVVVGFFMMQETKEIPKQQVQQEDHSHDGVDGAQGMLASMGELPTDYNSLVSIGNQTMDQKNFPIAAECYKRALAINSESVDVRTDYGACLHGMGLHERAIEEFMIVVKTNPKHGIATFNLGIVYYSMEQIDSAKAYFNNYLKLDPNGSASGSAKEYLKEIG